MTTDREFFERRLRKMAEGTYLDVDGRDFRRMYPCGFPTIYDTPEQSFLSKQVGSAWGVWTCTHKFSSDVYTIGHHAETRTRVYVDPDHAHMFKRLPSGELVVKDQYKE